MVHEIFLTNVLGMLSPVALSRDGRVSAFLLSYSCLKYPNGVTYENILFTWVKTESFRFLQI